MLLSWFPLAYRKARAASAVLLCVGVMFGGSFSAADAWGQKELHVAAAADLQPVMPVLAQAYEHATGVKLVVSFGSSAMLTEQILSGSPMDIFLAADFVYPEKIVAAGLADSGAPTPYAKGTLVLWARKDSPLQPLSMERLTDPRVKTIAIANELHAPYGRAAVSALKFLKLYDEVSPHLVVAENISQAAQFVESGNAQAGLVALSHALAPAMKDKGRYWTVPLDAYPTLNQAAVVISKSKQTDAAKKFLDFLRSAEASSLLTRYGFSLPGK
jgi:molybdate transport system substrate-binding protein